MKMVLGIAALVAILTTITLMPQKVYARNITIRGTITKEQQTEPVEGALISFQCGPPSSEFIRTDIPTDAAGQYLITLAEEECPLGTEYAAIVARLGNDWSAFRSLTMGSYDRVIDMALIKHTSIPEYGGVSGVLATGAGLGAIVFVRQRSTKRKHV